MQKFRKKKWTFQLVQRFSSYSGIVLIQSFFHLDNAQKDFQRLLDFLLKNLDVLENLSPSPSETILRLISKYFLIKKRVFIKMSSFILTLEVARKLFLNDDKFYLGTVSVEPYNYSRISIIRHSINLQLPLTSKASPNIYRSHPIFFHT